MKLMASHHEDVLDSPLPRPKTVWPAPCKPRT